MEVTNRETAKICAHELRGRSFAKAIVQARAIAGDVRTQYLSIAQGFTWNDWRDVLEEEELSRGIQRPLRSDWVRS